MTEGQILRQVVRDPCRPGSRLQEVMDTGWSLGFPDPAVSPPFSPPPMSISCPGPAGNKWNGCVTWFLAWLGQRGSRSVKLCPTLDLCCLLVALI